MIHSHAMQLLSDRLDRALTPTEEADLDAHLAACPECAATARSLPHALGRLDALPPVAGSQRVRAAVLADVRQQGRPAQWRPLRQGVQIAAAVLSIALVAIVLTTVFRGAGAPNPTHSGSAPASPTTGLPSCVAEQVQIDRQQTPLSGVPGVIFTLRFVKATGGAICQLDSPLTVSILNDDGSSVALQGNPVTVPLATELPGDATTFSFAWLNWCGDPGTYALRIEVPSLGDGYVETYPSWIESPACSDSQSPSTFGEAAEANPGIPDASPTT